MTSFGLVCAFLGAICWAACVFPFTSATRKMGINSMNMFRLLAGTLMVFLTALILESKSVLSLFNSSHYNAWLWLGLSGIISLAIGDYFSYRMYAILNPRLGSVLTTLSPATALIFGAVLLDEKMNTTGVIGILITILGVIGISLGKAEREIIPDHGHGSVIFGIIIGIFGALCHGAGLALSKKGFIDQAATGNSIGPVTGSFIRFSTASLVMVLALLSAGRFFPTARLLVQQPAKHLRIAFYGIMLGPVLAVSFAMTSIQHIDVAIAQTIFSLVPVIALIISYFLYKERITRTAFIGVFIAIAGVFILIWREYVQEYLLRLVN